MHNNIQSQEDSFPWRVINSSHPGTELAGVPWAPKNNGSLGWLKEKKKFPLLHTNDAS